MRTTEDLIKDLVCSKAEELKELDTMFSEFNLLTAYERKQRLEQIEKEKHVLHHVEKNVQVCIFHQSIIKTLESENDKMMGLNSFLDKCFAELVDGKCHLVIKDEYDKLFILTRWDYNLFANLSSQLRIFDSTFTFYRADEPIKQVTLQRPDQIFQVIAHLEILESFSE